MNALSEDKAGTALLALTLREAHAVFLTGAPRKNNDDDAADDEDDDSDN